MKILLFLLLAMIVSACQNQTAAPPANSELSAADRTEIEQAARDYWSARTDNFNGQPAKAIAGISLKRVEEDIYIVSAALVDDRSSNTALARRYRSGQKTFWKLEPLTGKWVDILGLDKNEEAR